MKYGIKLNGKFMTDGGKKALFNTRQEAQAAADKYIERWEVDYRTVQVVEVR